MIRQQTVTVTVAGANGSAVGSGESGVMSGRLVAIHIAYTTQPATADVTIATKSTPIRTLMTRSDSATDGWFYPRVLVQGVTAADLTAVYDTFPVNDHLTVAVAQGNAGAVVVTIYVDEK